MKTAAPENHYHWQVSIGCQARDPSNSSFGWDEAGMGCLVHSRIVLTTWKVWTEAAHNRGRQSEVMVRVGETDYICQLGHGLEERNLAALVLIKPACDIEGKEFKDFPSIASQSPEPGQTLGVLLRQHLCEYLGSGGGGFICYTFGHVSLLRGKKQLLYGLSGLEWQQTTDFGNAVFDPSGQLYGLATQYLKCDTFDAQVQGAHTGYLIFSPLTAKLREAAVESVKQLKWDK